MEVSFNLRKEKVSQCPFCSNHLHATNCCLIQRGNCPECLFSFHHDEKKRTLISWNQELELGNVCPYLLSIPRQASLTTQLGRTGLLQNSEQLGTKGSMFIHYSTRQFCRSCCIVLNMSWTGEKEDWGIFRRWHTHTPWHNGNTRHIHAVCWCVESFRHHRAHVRARAHTYLHIHTLQRQVMVTYHWMHAVLEAERLAFSLENRGQRPGRRTWKPQE